MLGISYLLLLLLYVFFFESFEAGSCSLSFENELLLAMSRVIHFVTSSAVAFLQLIPGGVHGRQYNI